MQDDHDLEQIPPQRGDEQMGQRSTGNPESLVRDDTWWINCLRVFLLGTLLIVAISISTGTYKLLSKLEHDTFRNEFDSLASQIARTFVHDLNLKLFVASLATQSISVASADGFPSADTAVFDKILAGVGQITHYNRLVFSPMIWTETDRHDFEAYVPTSKQVTDSNICHVCGEGMEVGSPDSNVHIEGYGTFTCSLLDQAGLHGGIPERNCPFLKDLLTVSCQCRPVSNSAPTDNNETQVPIATQIFRIHDGKQIPDNQPPPFSPIWQASPQPRNQAILYNQMSDPMRRQAIQTMIQTKLPTFTRTRYPCGEYQHVFGQTYDTPEATIFYPVISANSTHNQTIIGTIAMDFPWIEILGFAEKIPPKTGGLILVLENTDGQLFTFKIDSVLGLQFVGGGDLHDTYYDSMKLGSSFDDSDVPILSFAPEAQSKLPSSTLRYRFLVYPSDTFKKQFVTRTPIYYAAVVASIFLFTSAIFILYDLLVRRRQIKVMQSALQSNAIVSNVFPEFVTSRLMRNAILQQRPSTRQGFGSQGKNSTLQHGTAKHQLRILLGSGSGTTEADPFGLTEPIADFFPSVTVLFADIAGFTAWSSEREPVQIFQLLESVYQTFDTIAAKHDVFKVETIGDSYVAVTGLPVAQPDHAMRMARFAYDIMLHMHELAASLESLLGPGTGSLSIRVGLHSGSVTGGVLRGDKARFQLFGDTMNTAARMESTGEVNRIQASDSTAALLREAGNESWVEQRDSKVFVKGKGDMQTFWIDPDWQAASIVSGPTTAQYSVCDALPELGPPKKDSTEYSIERLVNWNSDLLERFLKKLLAARATMKHRQQRRSSLHFSDTCKKKPMQDVTEVIDMSRFDDSAIEKQLDPESVDLGDAVRAQLRKYVELIAGMYRNNPFHNFEHASHVAMSANKILKRIIKPEAIDYKQENVRKKDRKKSLAEQIHNSTFGISSDALMQFAVIFSAVIHDVDHTGVSNAQLVKENDEVALLYDDKCVAEQNSVQIAWDLLMEDRFSDLRCCIYTSGEEKGRFRQLIVNAVIATDIADRELQALRKNRWHKAFYEERDGRRSADEERSYKATVVFEYIIQASDVAHTMQHWHVYCKWNEHLFEERYKAYLAGREEKDPSLGWYNGEIWFFDNYIIPLARKLETCGVFGVSSDEYFNYALANRHEWERRGHEIVEQLREKFTQSNEALEQRQEQSDRPVSGRMLLD